MTLDCLVATEGNLGTTPFSHLLVHIIEHKLTGTLLVDEPSCTQHVIQLNQGAPTKVRPSDGYARFGELLIEEHLISKETLDHALQTRGLLGDVLHLSGYLDSPTLDWIAEVQFVRRMVRLFELPVTTSYRYLEGQDELADWGGDSANTNPLSILWAGLRMHGECSALIQSTLDQLSTRALRIHPAFVPGRFGFGQAELAVVAALQQSELVFDQLIEMRVAPEALVRKVIYALVLTRFIDTGSGDPIGAETALVRSLGRVQLRATLHRHGAAAPDPAGDGER